MATSKTVSVGCRLPNGVVLELGDKKVTLNGLNKVVIIGVDHGITEVDGDFWAAWSELNKDFTPFKNGAIFSAGDAKSTSALAEDLQGVKTGLEPIDPNATQAGGVQTAGAE